MVRDTDSVDRVLETKSDRPGIQAIQRHILALRSAVASRSVGQLLPDRRNLLIRRTCFPGRNALWIGCVRIEITSAGQSVSLSIDAPEFVNIVREEAIQDVNRVTSDVQS